MVSVCRPNNCAACTGGNCCSSSSSRRHRSTNVNGPRGADRPGSVSTGTAVRGTNPACFTHRFPACSDTPATTAAAATAAPAFICSQNTSRAADEYRIPQKRRSARYPASTAHRWPVRCDTPATVAAAVTDRPEPTASQNRSRTTADTGSRKPTEQHLRTHQALQRPIESEAPSWVPARLLAGGISCRGRCPNALWRPRTRRPAHR